MAKKKKICKIPYYISEAGHLLRTKKSSYAGAFLASEGKKNRKQRRKRGCLNGPAGTFQLTEKQKRNLPKKLQQAILNYHRRQGKTIYE
jgi:hypothetical protein